MPGPNDKRLPDFHSQSAGDGRGDPAVIGAEAAEPKGEVAKARDASGPLDRGFQRYHRQMILPGFGLAGQCRLGDSSAVVVGLGALGTVAADALVRAGVGRVVLIDRDVVEVSNLQRQTLFAQADADARTPKAIAAADRLRLIHPDARITPVIADIAGDLVESIVLGVRERETAFEEPTLAEARPVGVVLDCTDNFETRYLLNDACVKHGIPLVYAGAVGVTGLTMTIIPGRSACLRCVFPECPQPGSSPTCDSAGVLGPVAGVVANMQAAEAIKILLGAIDQCSTLIREVNLWNVSQRTMSIREARDPACVCCAERRFEFLDAPVEHAAQLCGADAVQITPQQMMKRGAAESGAALRVDLAGLSARLKEHGVFELTRFMLRGRIVCEDVELTVFSDGRAIVSGTRDAGLARRIYAKYVGA